MATQLGILRFRAVVVRDVVAIEIERDASPAVSLIEAVSQVSLNEPQVRRRHLEGPLQRVAVFAIIRSFDDIGVKIQVVLTLGKRMDEVAQIEGSGGVAMVGIREGRFRKLKGGGIIQLAARGIDQGSGIPDPP